MSQGKNVTVRKQKIKKKHIKARLAFFLFLTVLLLLTVIFAEQICPYDPNAQDNSLSLQPPSFAHPAGTDRFGRDMLSRIIVGLRTSVASTLLTTESVVATIKEETPAMPAGGAGGMGMM